MYLKLQTFRNVVFILTCLNVSRTQSLTYKDCTEIIKEEIVGNNNGTLQFQYVHYPRFWLYQDVEKKEETFDSVEPRLRTKTEKSFVFESTSHVTILDIEKYPSLTNAQHRKFWSWKVIGKFKLRRKHTYIFVKNNRVLYLIGTLIIFGIPNLCL